MIESFSGKYNWLSNFFPSPVYIDGVRYPTAEHAYQASKTTDEAFRMGILKCRTANQAKQLGKVVPLRPDWDKIKLQVMEEILRSKFSNPILRELLKKTGDQELVEGNWWDDVFWGSCGGLGENHLGKLLMKLRAEL